MTTKVSYEYVSFYIKGDFIGEWSEFTKNIKADKRLQVQDKSKDGRSNQQYAIRQIIKWYNQSRKNQLLKESKGEEE